MENYRELKMKWEHVRIHKQKRKCVWTHIGTHTHTDIMTRIHIYRRTVQGKQIYVKIYVCLYIQCMKREEHSMEVILMYELVCTWGCT